MQFLIGTFEESCIHRYLLQNYLRSIVHHDECGLSESLGNYNCNFRSEVRRLPRHIQARELIAHLLHQSPNSRTRFDSRRQRSRSCREQPRYDRTWIGKDTGLDMGAPTTLVIH